MLPTTSNVLLDKLEQSAVATSDTRRSSSSWTLSKDAELCTFLQLFSSHIHDKVSELSETFANLDQTIERVDRATMGVTLDYLILSDEKSMEYERSSSEKDTTAPDLSSRMVCANDVVQEVGSHKITHGTSNIIGNQRDEEEIAIEHGIQTAQTIFYDPPADGNPHDYVSDHFFGFEDDDNGDENNERYSSSCHYYESSSGDIFNQRPLPLVIGSDEFLESEDVGIGGDGGRRGETMGRQKDSAIDETQQTLQQYQQEQTKEQTCIKNLQNLSQMVEEDIVISNVIDNGNEGGSIVIQQQGCGPETTLDSVSSPAIPLSTSSDIDSLTLHVSSNPTDTSAGLNN